MRIGERNPWGELEGPAYAWDNPAGIDELLRFTTYQYDAVLGKHFAKTRFYAAGLSRMLSRDPVKNGQNPYLYGENDPVNQVDLTGEFSVLGGGIVGGLLGFGEGFLNSALSQLGSGECFHWREAMDTGAIYGNKGLKNLGNAFVRGAGAGQPNDRNRAG